MVRSFFQRPNIVYANRALQSERARLKFDLATHIAHKVLHGGDGMKSAHATGAELGSSPEGGTPAGMNAQDVLQAWRDFECSFFASSLLAPRIPFRRFLTARSTASGRHEAGVDALPHHAAHDAGVGVPHWHFFDAYPPGFLRAVYRGNGIPLPWGNLAQVGDPCPHWAVFRTINGERGDSGSQISVLRDGDRSMLYCCHSLRVRDMAGNPHVLSVGVDLAPALDSNGVETALAHRVDLRRMPAAPRRSAHSQSGRADPRCRRQRAQHLLDRGRPGAAGADHLPTQHPLSAHRPL